MKLDEYNTIMQFIEQHSSNCPRTVLSDVVSKFVVQYPHHTIMSIFLTCLQRKVKVSYHSKTKVDNLKWYYKLYEERMQPVSNLTEMKHNENNELGSTPPISQIVSAERAILCNGDEPTLNSIVVSKTSNVCSKSVLIGLANEFEFPPCLMARAILEQYLIRDKSSTVAKHNCALTSVAQITDSRTKRVSLTSVTLARDKNTNSELTSQPIKHLNGPPTSYASNEPHVAVITPTRKQATEKVLDGAITAVSCQGLSHETSSSIPASNLQTPNSESGYNRADITIPPKSIQQPSKAISKASSQTSIKQKVSSWMKDPFLIPDEALREQVLQCTSYDVCYGPINDAIRHSIGLEYEEKLVQCVKKHNLPILDENDLRKRGYDKTPDIKLEVPISVNGHPVCWIESKASFGDLQTHSEYLRDQYYSYWNRFGPGIVIYWFGFIDTISDEMRKLGILVMDDFPTEEQITFMNP